MNNTKYVFVTPSQGAMHLGKSTYFRKGYTSYTKKLAFDYNIVEKHDAIYYASGRNFAIWCKINRMPRAVWRNNVAAKTVIERIARAIENRYVI